MLSEGCNLLAKIADLLSHMHVTERMLIKPARASVHTTAKLVANPPNYERYDVTSRGSPSSGPPPLSSISSSAVAINQMWYPTPNTSNILALLCYIPLAWLDLECDRTNVGRVLLMCECGCPFRMCMR
jgi:hypothetical protein